MNFIHSFRAEWLKKKRSLSAWLIVAGAFFTPLIVLIARLVHYKSLPAINAAGDFWESLWRSSWESMSIFLLPMIVILSASLVTQLEYKNNTWKQLHTTPQTFTTIYFAKLSVIIIMIAEFFILFNIGIYLSGIIPGMFIKGVPFPNKNIPYTFFFTENVKYFIECLPIISLQYLVSLLFKNFLVPVGVGIALWILSIAVISWQYGYFIPYTYDTLHYLRNEGKFRQDIQIDLYALFYFLLFLSTGYILYLKKSEKG